MALLGTGAICIWNDVTPEGRADFYAWHVAEHIPERVGIPGFRRGRRYIAAETGTAPEFFTLYEVEEPQVLVGQAYKARLDAPTPWTRRATSGFRKTCRALTRVEVSLGTGSGGSLASLRLAPRVGDDLALRDCLADDVMPRLMMRPQITGAHLCVTDLAASAEKSNESRNRTDIGDPPKWVILIEACGVEPVAQAATACADAVAGLVTGETLLGVYRLEFALARSAFPSSDPEGHAAPAL